MTLPIYRESEPAKFPEYKDKLNLLHGNNRTKLAFNVVSILKHTAFYLLKMLHKNLLSFFSHVFIAVLSRRLCLYSYMVLVLVYVHNLLFTDCVEPRGLKCSWILPKIHYTCFPVTSP